MATLKQSDGATVVSSTLNPITTKAMIKAGHAVPISGTDITSVKLVSSAKDTLISSATTNNPLLLGVDDLRFTPLQYPEKL